MNDENHQPVIDLLDRAMAALRSTAASESPPPRVVVATIEALNSRFGQTETNSSEIRPREIETRQRMFRIARYSTVAAAILLMVVGASLVLFMDRGASPAFGQVIENVEKAKSVVFDCETTLGGLGDAPGHTSRQKYYMQGGLVRAEIRVVRGGNETPVTDIFIGDTDKKELLQIRYAPKTAEKRPLAGAAVEFLKNPVDWFRTLTDKDAELVGNERLNGADALIYNLKRFNFGQSDELKEGESAKVWVDPKTHLPVQLVVEKFFPGAAVRSRAILTDFHWNELLDPKLFEMAVPDGFKVAEGSANPRFTDGQGEDTHRFAAEEIMQLPFSLALKQVREARSMSYTQTATSEGQQRPVITKEFIAEDGRRRSEHI